MIEALPGIFCEHFSHVNDFSCRNKALTGTLLKYGYSYHKLERHFQTFIADTVGWWGKYNVSLKKLLQLGVSEPAFYVEFVYRFRKIVGKS